MDATKTFTTFSQYATPEVLTVFGALFAVFIGYKVTAKTVGLVAGIAKNFSFLGLTAAVLFMAGLGSTGIGVGELVGRYNDSPSNTDQRVGVSDADLVKLAGTTQDKDITKTILDYANTRDGKNKRNGHDIERLAALIEKTTPDNKEAVVALINYMKAKEERKSLDAATTVASTTLLTSTLSDSKDRDQPGIAPTGGGRNSAISLQTAFMLILAGFGGVATGITAYRWRKNNPQVASNDQQPMSGYGARR